MDTNDISACFAAPPFLIGGQKYTYTSGPDVFKVSHQAGFIFQPVTSIQLFKPFTGIYRAFTAKARFRFFQILTVDYDTPDTRTRFITLYSASGTFVFCSQEGITNPAVYTARGYQLRNKTVVASLVHKGSLLKNCRRFTDLNIALLRISATDSQIKAILMDRC
jgi:hypothetical protein